MKYKNRKGFTLIEMLVVVAVIAALSVAIGVSANQMMAKSQENDYEETYKEIIKNARIFAEIDENNNLITKSEVTVSLGELIAKGLQDEKILLEKNPALKEDLNFASNMEIIVSIINSKKIVSINVGECTINNNTAITSDNLNDFEWGTC